MSKVWGFLRETEAIAIKVGIEPTTGIGRTGLEEYLKVIFPDATDWVHDKTIDTLPKEIKCRKRPDYHSEDLKLIIEFDGIPHYSSPQKILDDYKTTKLYESYGYKVVRIPYFIQLTNDAVKELFNVDVKEDLFDPNVASFTDLNGVPASLCPAGICRMAYEFQKFPYQYIINLEALRKLGDDFLTGAQILDQTYFEYVLGISNYYLPESLR